MNYRTYDSKRALHIVRNEENVVLIVTSLIDKNELQSTTLYPITPEELLKKRKAGIPLLVYKRRNDLWAKVLETKNEIRLLGCNCSHKCGKCARTCPCEKILDQFLYDLLISPPRNLRFRDLVDISKRIEKYDYVLEGVETYNCGTNDMLLVLKCDLYKPAFMGRPSTKVTFAPSPVVNPEEKSPALDDSKDDEMDEFELEELEELEGFEGLEDVHHPDVHPPDQKSRDA